MSDSINLSNGVRQGGILSPYIFVSVYMDELSTAPNGCNVGYTCVNNVMYADGLVMFCPSSRWIQSFFII